MPLDALDGFRILEDISSFAGAVNIVTVERGGVKDRLFSDISQYD